MDAFSSVYLTLEEAFRSCRSQMNGNGYNINKRRSKRNKSGEIYKVWLVCQHSRSYENSRTPDCRSTNRMKKTSTRHMDCPWSAVIQSNDDLAQWSLQLTCENHNHIPAAHISAFHSARSFTDDQKALIADMMQVGVEPKTIIAALRQRYPGIAVISQDVYNAIKRIRQEELAGRTPIEALLDQLITEQVMHSYLYDDNRRLPICFSLRCHL